MSLIAAGEVDPRLITPILLRRKPDVKPDLTLKPDERLTLIASDPRISSALFILSISRMLLIYLNYRFWIRMWKNTYAKFLSDGRLDRKRDTCKPTQYHV